MSVFPLTFRVQIAPGASLTADPATWVWQDITRWVRAGIRITRGRSDEGGTTSPSSCALTLKSPAGRWLPRNPASPEYPGWRLGCPLRVQVSVLGQWWTRHTGFASEIEPRLADRGVDTYEVDVVASGITRRLAQGSAVRSPLLRQMSSMGLLAYCPLEDGAGTTYPAVYGRQSQPQPAARAAGPLTFGADANGLPGSASAVRLDSTTARIAMPVGGGVFIVGDTTVATVMVYVTSPQLDVEADLMTVTVSSPQVDKITVRASKTTLKATAYLDGDQVGTTSMPWPDGADPTTGWVGVQVTLTRPGLVSFLQLGLRVHAVGDLTWTASPTGGIAGTIVGQMTAVTLLPAGVQGTTYAHLGATVRPSLPTSTAWAAAGYAGEDAGARLERLAADQAVPLVPVGTAETAMGPQPVGGLLDLAREVEAADGGMLYESLDGRLAYLRRVDRYNRPVDIGLVYSQLAPGLAPTSDDRSVRNDWTVSRPGGAGGVQVSDEAHVAEYGRYEQSTSVNVATDADAGDQASWRVHLGTVEQMRYPVLTLNWGREQTAAALPAWLARDPLGARLTVTGVPPELSVDGVIDQQIEGYTEQLDRYAWTVTINTSPNAPWRVALVDGEDRVAADGSTLAAPLAASAMTLSLASTAENGPWTTAAEDFPLDLRVGEERVTVSAISGTSSPQTAIITARGVNGIRRSWLVGTEVDVWFPAIVAL
ncbi:hypothetical protein [Micromonospora okii]|uniref:hypothetical protein n=1 Tax=Micromonospora okii TaxID=1182970 RepID=UPI001E5AA7E5|nr:hypothetical protein [Micromonospora okii]